MKMWALLYIFILFYDDIRVVMICLLKPSGCDFEGVIALQGLRRES